MQQTSVLTTKYIFVENIVMYTILIRNEDDGHEKFFDFSNFQLQFNKIKR